MVHKAQSYHPLKIEFRLGIMIYHHFQTYHYNNNNKPYTKNTTIYFYLTIII